MKGDGHYRLRVGAADVDAYLAGCDEPHRSTLQEMRRRILPLIPDAEQVISHRMPAFKVGAKTVAGWLPSRTT